MAVVTVTTGAMKPLLAKLTIIMEDEHNRFKGLRKEVSFLYNELCDMYALLEKADRVDELDPQAKEWRQYTIEMTYDIEDIIDDLMHCVGEAVDKMGILKKASQYLRTFKHHRRIANQIQDIKTQLIEISRRRMYRLDQGISSTAHLVDPRMSALYKEAASLVGIDAQKDELVNWAMDKAQQLKLMAIIGFAGLGKTTLANEVYREVGEKFDCKAFLSIPQKPHMIKILNSLLSQLGLDNPYSPDCSLQDLLDYLRQHLHDKR